MHFGFWAYLVFPFLSCVFGLIENAMEMSKKEILCQMKQQKQSASQVGVGASNLVTLVQENSENDKEVTLLTRDLRNASCCRRKLTRSRKL